MRKVTFIKIVVCILSFATLTGCWSARELDTIAIVMGVGLDKPKELNEVEITVQVVDPSKIKFASKEGNGKGSSNKAYINLKDRGITISQTLMEVNHKLDRDLFFSDNEVIILGHTIAEEGIGKKLDFFLRNRETRMLVNVLIAEGSASEVLDISPELENINAANIAELIELGQKHSEVVSVNLMDFSTKVMSKTTAPVAPMIEIIKEDSKKVHISQTAVFKKDKMVGKLDEKETKGYLWTANKVKKGYTEVTLTNSEPVSIETINSKTKITPKILNGKVSFNIEIKEEGEISDQLSVQDLAKPQKYEELEKAKAVVIEKQIMAAVRKAKELNADIFAFGETVNKKYPKQWKTMEKNWNEIFPDVEVSVKVETKLRRNGRITKPIMAEEE